jgi:uncharacterized membrane protein
MRARDFISRLEQDKIVHAIQQAEKQTSGEIRVFISRHEVPDPLAAAQEQFHRLAMEKTRERNGVLIFVAPRSRKFAVIGDRGVHERCGEVFWQELAGQMKQLFQEQNFSGGLLHAITRAGRLLGEHFPRRPDDENELPDKIEHD